MLELSCLTAFMGRVSHTVAQPLRAERFLIVAGGPWKVPVRPIGIDIEYKEVAKADAGRPGTGIGRKFPVCCILSGSVVHRGCVIGLTDRAWRPVINRNQEVPASKLPELARIIKALTIDMNLITRCLDLQ